MAALKPNLQVGAKKMSGPKGLDIFYINSLKLNQEIPAKFIRSGTIADTIQGL